MICIRCHEKTALSERGRAILSRDVACEIPPDLCFGCIVTDPAYRPAIMRWTYRKRDETIQTFRAMMARPLELIDDWVDSLRHDK